MKSVRMVRSNRAVKKRKANRVKKTQPIPEYLMIYSWAMLLAAVVVSIIYLFMFVPPEMLQPSCFFLGGTYCQDAIFISNATYTSTASVSTTSTILTYFVETGLPSGATWNVTYDGILNTSVPSTSWTYTDPYPLAIDDHACSSYNGYAYCVAGVQGTKGATNSVYFTHILSSGTIGNWSATSAYPISIYDSSCNAYNGYIYCIAGRNDALYNLVYYAPISSDGVGNWTATNSYPLSVYNHICVAYSNNLYCIGGDVGANDTTSVYYAPILSNGAVGSWIATNSYPLAVDDSTCNAYNGYVYCVAGSRKEGVHAVYDSVYYSQILSSNTLGAWTSTTPYPTALYDHTCASSSGYIYCIGGYTKHIYPAQITSNVFFSQLTPSGVGVWTKGQNYPLAERSQSSFSYDGFIYVVGGYHDPTFKATDTVYFIGSKSAVIFDSILGTQEYSISNQTVNGNTYIPVPSSGTLTAGNVLEVTFISASTAPT
jgi:hypothetical protein